jgi:hypothetical protein
MELSQGNSLCSYLYLELAKMLCFSFSLFSSAKSEKRRQNRSCGVGWRHVGTSGSRQMAGKGDKRVNIMQKMCTHVCKCKNDKEQWKR